MVGSSKPVCSNRRMQLVPDRIIKEFCLHAHLDERGGGGGGEGGGVVLLLCFICNYINGFSEILFLYMS